MRRTQTSFSKKAIQRREAVLALRHAKRAMTAAGMKADQVVAFIQHIDANCAGPCKTAKQAYGSLIWALADALIEAENEIAAVDADAVSATS